MNGSKIFIFERISTLKEYKEIFWRFLFLGKYLKKIFIKYVIISFWVNINKILEKKYEKMFERFLFFVKYKMFFLLLLMNVPKYKKVVAFFFLIEGVRWFVLSSRHQNFLFLKTCLSCVFIRDFWLEISFWEMDHVSVSC